MADTLSAAIHKKFNSDASLTSTITGGLWTGEIPEGTSPPYAWLDLPDMATTPFFEGLFERSTFVVHIYGIGAQQAEDCADAFKQTFDYTSLSFISAASIWCQPRRYRLIPEKARWKDGTLMYRVVLTYDVLAQRDR